MNVIKRFRGKERKGARTNEILFATEKGKFVIMTKRDSSVVDKFSFPQEKIEDVMTATVDTLISLSDFGPKGGDISEKTASKMVINSFKDLDLEDKGWILAQLIKDYAGIEKIKKMDDYNKCMSACGHALYSKNLLKAVEKDLGFKR